MAKEFVTKTGNTLAWVAIGISILALIISLMALNQPARVRPASETASQDLQTQIKSLQQQFDINQARQKLEDVRQRVATGGADMTQIQKDIAQIRNDLRERFQNAAEITKQSWQQLDDELNQVEISLKEGGANILDAIDKAINTLKTKIRYG
ncbi:hypothetical protein HYT74_01885 [Candidatus Daviesbacteria bacterium]|nr:hypothetical protein [Candidatus Daviesbacteria bacterium]